MKILNNLDLQRNQLLNARIHVASTEPSNPLEGQIYYDSSTHRAYLCVNPAGNTFEDRWRPADGLDASQNAFTNFSDGTTVLSADNSSDTIKILGSSGISVVATDDDPTDGDKITISNTGVTGLTAGDGISLSGSTGNVTVNHLDTSSVTGVTSNNSGNTFIQDVTLSFDTFGHVTGASVATATATDHIYSIKSSSTTGGATLDLDASGSGSGTDAVSFLGNDGTVVTQVDANTIRVSSHNQNTDTGTTSTSFALDSDAGNGVLLKNDSGELQVRNLLDSTYADIRVRDLYVEGTQTIINSDVVSIGDSELELNGDITISAENSDGGITVKRLDPDNETRKDAKVTYNDSIDRWTSTFGDVDGSLVTAVLANKVVAKIGDGSNVAYVITHNLGTKDAIVSLRDDSAPYEQVYADIEMTTENTLTVRFAIAPTTDQYNVTIIG